jgi:hypothetical protein
MNAINTLKRNNQTALECDTPLYYLLSSRSVHRRIQENVWQYNFICLLLYRDNLWTTMLAVYLQCNKTQEQLITFTCITLTKQEPSFLHVTFSALKFFSGSPSQSLEIHCQHCSPKVVSVK